MSALFSSSAFLGLGSGLLRLHSHVFNVPAPVPYGAVVLEEP
jgi:hypothetical protein